METKHTKKPWVYKKSRKGLKYIVSGEYWDSFCKIWACTIDYNGVKSHETEAEANAKLIVAAPELLEACFNLVNAASGDTIENLKIALSNAKQAIKKATE